jgi:SAM-dependent methyltransferase
MEVLTGGNVRMTALTCRLVEERFSAPRAPRSALRRAIRRWHAEREARFASRNPILPESQLETIRRVYETLPAGRAVLDVGGGNGRWRRLLGDVGEYTVVDVATPDPASLEPGITHVVADATELPFGDSTFDLVLMIEMLQYVAEPATALAEAARVLAPGGALVLTTRQAWRAHGPPEDRFRFTRYALEHMLDSVGLRVTVLTPLGGPASVVTAALENNVPLLTKPLVKQLLSNQLWRLARAVDRTLFRESVHGAAPDVSGWLVVARRSTDVTSAA